MTHDIDKHITIINDALAWAREYGKNSFPAEQFKNYRRELAKIRGVLSSNCSAAAYGESQVGKSYLMSSLLSSAGCPFEIENGGRRYSFIDELNPSGGNNAKIESTGVITRFTTRHSAQKPAGMIRISNLSVLDIILLLADSYYNDIKIDPDKSLSANSINTKLNELATLWSGKPAQQEIITEDDIRDINDYIREVIGNAAAAVYQSNFCKIVAPVIYSVPHQCWPDVFSLLWNQNAEITRLFTTLINAYDKISFRREVYVPFDAVLRSKGTLLKIEWLDTVCGARPAVSDDSNADSNDDVPVTDIYDTAGQLVARDFNKGELSALIAELTFELPAQLVEERKFLNRMDLLDFPGARSREKYKESEIATVLPRMLRRGKVAYLFNKYSRSQQIGCVLFCHHNDQKAEPTIGDTINSWIEDNIGKDAQERTRMLQDTRGISPLFLIATKFNIDLQYTKNDKPDDKSTLDKHWNRFDTVLPEIVGPSKWLDEWTASAGVTKPFQSIYPLRDFYWSAQNRLFDGYSDGEMKSPEKSLHIHPDYPRYMDCLRRSFLGNQFVRDHFASPEKTWEEVATLNNDGSKPIIRDLGVISGVLDEARRKRCLERLVALKKAIDSTLRVYYDDTDAEAKNKRVRAIAGEIRRTLTAAIAHEPATFGHVIDRFMVSPEAIRNIAYDIIVLHTDTPRDFNNVSMIRANAGIDTAASRQENIQRLISFYQLDTEDELQKFLMSQDTTVDEVISGDINELATTGGVITKHVTDYWIDHLNRAAAEMSETLPCADELVFMFAGLFGKLGAGQHMAKRIDRYTALFGEQERINAIGDYASLTLNSFVSTVGREYMPDSELENLRGKADSCKITIDLSPTAWNKAAEPQPLEETLRVFDDAAKILNSQHVNMDALRRLPFWSNYYKWENLVFIGLLYSSDISHCDPVSNGKVRDLIDRNQALYSGQ